MPRSWPIWQAPGVLRGTFSIRTTKGHETLNVALMGAVRACRAFMPGMKGRGYGRIVLTASENAVQPYVEKTPYNASEAGIANLGKGLFMAYGKEGVHVNVVSPAYVKTPTTDAMMEEPA